MASKGQLRTRKRRGRTSAVAPAPRRRRSALADLVDLQAIERDGLAVTGDGTYVRVIECQGVPNVVTAEPSSIERVESGWRELCAAIPNNQRLVFVAQNDPIPVDDALRPDVENVQAAMDRDRRAGRDDLAQMRRRLYLAQRQTVLAAARGEQPAVHARYWVVVPWRPTKANVDLVRSTIRPTAGSTVHMSWETHQRAARESLNWTESVLGHLEGIGIDGHILGPVELLAELWERLHPGSDELPSFEAFDGVADYVRHTDRESAAAHRRAIVDVLTGGDLPCGLDDRDSRWLRHADGTIEETLHLATPPALTSPWWLSLLLSVPLQATVAVHIGVGNRAQIRTKYRRRWARQSAAADYKRIKGQQIYFDEREALQESEALEADLSSTVNSGVYDVGIYASYRAPHGDAEAFDEQLAQLATQFSAFTDARIVRGRRCNVPGWQSTLLLGTDRLRANRRYGDRNIAHCIPLATASCGSPDGLFLGFADPGSTLERINPYDSLMANHVTLICGPSGGGKTVLMNTLLSRGLSQGLRGWIIDRSSTLGADGESRSRGHYSGLMSLVPGARTIHVGGGEHIINPWDVPDLSAVASGQTEFLLALHALLVGEIGANGEQMLTALEASLIRTGVKRVYQRCLSDPSVGPPRESLLRDELERTATAEDVPELRAAARALAEKIRPLCGDGSLAHIADKPTTVTHEAPLTLFDIGGVEEDLLGALILTIVHHIDGLVQRNRSQHVEGKLGDLGPWAGRMFLTIEEGWRLTQTPRAGAWLNEYARRSRHYALWLLLVTQHFRDLDNPQGRALMGNAQLRFALRNQKDDLEYARDTGGFTDVDIENIPTLTTRKGLYSTVWVVSPRGRGKVRISLGAMEYWITNNDPDRDQPAREAALAAADGDGWRAMELLCSPAWHDERARAGAA